MSNDPEKVISKGGIRVRKFIFPFMRAIALLISPYKLHIIKKAKIPKGTPIIYASTHGFKDDVAIAVILANNPFYILFGNLKQFFNTLEGFLAWLNGAIVFDRGDKVSRKMSLTKMQRTIELGANIFICPEGTWNLTDSLLVMKLYSGVYELAKSTGALVVPIITHIEGKVCYAVLDDSFDIAVYEKEEGIRILRDKMATAKYELMEAYSNFSRDELEAGGKSLRTAWEEHKETLIRQVKYYHPMEHEIYQYKDNAITEYTKAFEHLEEIKITKDNAFLLRPNRTEDRE
jgi:hypothetical protein